MFPAGSRLNDHYNFKHIYTAPTIRRQAHFIGKNTQTGRASEKNYLGIYQDVKGYSRAFSLFV
jgi:hypothetical protein